MEKSLKYFYLMCFVLCRFLFSQDKWEINKYYAVDTNIIITQQEKLKFKRVKLPSYPKKRKIPVELKVRNLVRDKTNLGSIEGYYTQELQDNLLMCAIDISDTTKKYCIIGKCNGTECDPDIDGVDCDICIPIHFTLYVPYGTYILIEKTLPRYTDGDWNMDSIELKCCLNTNNFNFSDCYCKYHPSNNGSMLKYEFIPIIIDEKNKKFIWRRN